MHPAGMVHETGEATERFLRSAAEGEVDANAARRRNVEAGKARAAEPPRMSVSGPRFCLLLPLWVLLAMQHVRLAAAVLALPCLSPWQCSGALCNWHGTAGKQESQATRVLSSGKQPLC